MNAYISCHFRSNRISTSRSDGEVLPVSGSMPDNGKYPVWVPVVTNTRAGLGSSPPPTGQHPAVMTARNAIDSSMNENWTGYCCMSDTVSLVVIADLVDAIGYYLLDQRQMPVATTNEFSVPFIHFVCNYITLMDTKESLLRNGART